jgi:DNA-binding MarR family transcriptional regulator
MKRGNGSRGKTGLDSFVEGISLLVLELGRHPESSSILTYGQETLLTLLSQGGKMSLKDVKSHLHINTFQMSRLLSSLENYVEDKNRIPLVVREVNEQDKRQWVISISDDGRRVLTEELHRRKLRVKKILNPLTQEEKAGLMSIIQKMIAAARQK